MIFWRIWKGISLFPPFPLFYEAYTAKCFLWLCNKSYAYYCPSRNTLLNMLQVVYKCFYAKKTRQSRAAHVKNFPESRWECSNLKTSYDCQKKPVSLYFIMLMLTILLLIFWRGRIVSVCITAKDQMEWHFQRRLHAEETDIKTSLSVNSYPELWRTQEFSKDLSAV